jgi:DNA-binding response OmpR family regulator
METIVIQETDQDILDILFYVLKTDGFKVYALAESDQDFLDLIDKARPHVVLLDYRFNDADAVRLCRAIKTGYPHLPVIALSCHTDIRNVYHRMGFDDYIEKPFDLERLSLTLRKHIPGKA